MKQRMVELTNLQFALLLTLPVVLFLLVVVAYPVGYAFWLSLHRTTFFGGAHIVFCGFENYAVALRSPEFWNGVAVSLRFALESVVLTLVIGLGMALSLARVSRGKGLIYTLSILPWAISRYGAGLMFKYLLRGRTGLLTALSFLFGFDAKIDILGVKTVVEGLAIGNAWNLAPLVAFFLLANIRTIPRRLYDLAELDGFKALGKFLNVTLPQLRYTLFVFTCIIIVLSLKVFDYIYVQTGGGPGVASSTLTYYIYKESFLHLHLGYGAALSFYLLLIIVSITLLLFVIWGRKEA